MKQPESTIRIPNNNYRKMVVSYDNNKIACSSSNGNIAIINNWNKKPDIVCILLLQNQVTNKLLENNKDRIYTILTMY